MEVNKGEEEEEQWSMNDILENTRTVSLGLEALRTEHESQLNDIRMNINEEEGEDNSMLIETKEGVLAESFNTLSNGVQDANLIMTVIQYISMLEGERGKLKTQVRRLADENVWLRQELQTSQTTLQEVETELCKVKEERHHLNYLMSLPQVNRRAVEGGEEMIEDNTNNDGEEESANIGEGNKREGHQSSDIKREGEDVLSDDEHYQKLHQYAMQHMHQGRHEVAVSLCKKAVQELEKTSGRYHPERANMLNIMVVIYREQGKVKESVNILREVLEIREKLNGPTHQTVASTLNNLSVLHGKLGEYSTAEQFCRRALEIRQKLLGPTHPDIAQQLINLATLCSHLGKYEEVEWYYQRALEIYHTEYGPDDPRVAKTLNYLGKCYMKQGNLEAAESVFKKVRTSVQAQDSSIGRDSREQSSSPLLGRDTPPPSGTSHHYPSPPTMNKRSMSAQAVTHDSIRRFSVDSKQQQNDDQQKLKQGRNSVSSNVLKFFRWGGAGGGAGTDNS